MSGMKLKRDEITAEVLNELLHYNPESGILTWKERGLHWFSGSYQKSEHKRWNTRYAGTRALDTDHGQGLYKQGHVLGITFKAHRVIWCMMTGEWPDIVDHINGVYSDNRWINLREVSAEDNCRNICIAKNNTSGYIGVSFCNTSQRWVAHIGYQGKRKNLGRYHDIEDAIKARREAEIKYGFHENHGRESFRYTYQQA